MEEIKIISSASAIIITLILSLIFLIIGFYYSKKNLGLNSYLVANRNIKTFSLTCSFVS